MPNASIEIVIPVTKAPLPRIATAAGAAFLAFIFASTRLAAQMGEVSVTIPAVSALTETVREAGAADIVTHDFDGLNTARNRAVPVRLYLPAQLAPAQTLPPMSHRETWGR